jgi:cell division cycle 2-like protein
MWSVGCIFAELMTTEPLFPGKNETDQIYKIFRLLGQPSSESWTDFHLLPGSKNIISPSSTSIPIPPFSSLRQKFKYSTQNCLDLLSELLSCDPSKRISADEALKHPYFEESPPKAHPASFGSFPSVAAVSIASNLGDLVCPNPTLIRASENAIHQMLLNDWPTRSWLINSRWICNQL